MLIRAIVYAEDKEQALDRAKSRVFNRLTENQHPFDYYVTFHPDESTLGVSGEERWGELPYAVEYDSKKGRELVEEGWEFTKKRYRDAAEKVRDWFNSDESELEDLWKTGHVGDNMIRHQMFKLGCYTGSPIFLYKNHGEGIRHKEMLDNTLGEYAPDEDDDEEIFVVPADVHY
jgi:hypothetical protein